MAQAVFMLGRNVAFTVATGTDDGAGAITYVTAVAMTGKAEAAEQRHRREVEQVLHLDSLLDHNVHLLDSWFVSMTGIKRLGGTNPDPLEAAFNLKVFGKVVVSTSLLIYTYRGIFGELTIPWQRGPARVVLALLPIDDGAANPTIAAP